MLELPREHVLEAIFRALGLSGLALTGACGPTHSSSNTETDATAVDSTTPLASSSTTPPTTDIGVDETSGTSSTSGGSSTTNDPGTSSTATPPPVEPGSCELPPPQPPPPPPETSTTDTSTSDPPVCDFDEGVEIQTHCFLPTDNDPQDGVCTEFVDNPPDFDLNTCNVDFSYEYQLLDWCGPYVQDGYCCFDLRVEYVECC